ncbi:MAG: FtsW/RodA/SpoVE family cell cycle protein [Verrucomicrobiales bacterium]
MTPLLRKFLGHNWMLFLTVLGLLIFGVFAVYSSCWMREEADLATKWRDHILFAAAGLVVYLVASLIDYRWLKYLAIPAYLVSVGLVLMAKENVYGTEGWIKIGGFAFQPSQLMIASGIILIATIISQIQRIHSIFRHPMLRLLSAGAVAGLSVLLVLKQGDMGSAMVWIPVFAAMIVVGNIPFRYIITLSLVATLLIPFAFYFGLKPYQKTRITVLFDMLQGKKVDTAGEAWSYYNNVTAIGSGGWQGKGFKSAETMNAKGFISKTTAINDFIFVVVGEEHGFRGGLLLIVTFLFLLLQCLFIAFFSRDVMGRLIVAGVVGLIFAHTYQNIGMDLLIMPITGIPLPLISYGGTFTVIVMGLLGLVQSVWVNRHDYESSEVRSGMSVDMLD